MSIIQGNTKSSESTFYPKVINGSLRFNDDDSAYLSWTPASAGDRKTWTWSGWVKRGNLSSGQRIFHASTDSNNRTEFYFRSDDQIEFFSAVGGVHKANIKTNAKFRDPSAWYHLVVVLDAVNTSLNIYVNGVLQTLTTTTAVVNTNQMVNATNVHTLGRYNPATSSYLDAYLANVHFIDGQALTADDFGETKNGVWVAKDYAGTFGTNGFYLTFEDDTEVEAFNTVLYRGNGGTQSVTGMGFQPDLVWIKKRGPTAASHRLLDSVRGVQKNLYSDLTSAEQTQNSVMSFDSDGVTVGDSAGTNGSGDTFVAWGWKAGDSNVSNTDGTITSTVRANDTYGFSIVSYTGTGANATVGHGLSSAPDMIFIKDRSAANSWTVWHGAIMTNAGYLVLDGTQAANTTDTGYWNSTAPSSSLISLGTRARVNTSGNNYIAYCWAEKSGYSKFGTYTANNSTDGPEVDLGFKPAFVLIKHTQRAENWIVFDGTRETVNDRNFRLFPSSSSAESAIPNDQGMRFLSTAEGDSIDGFKLTVAGGYGVNDTEGGSTYIYAAFADTREAAFWLDQSGNDNDWQPVNLDHNDTVSDSPTDNFCTWNPLNKGSAITLKDGNLSFTQSATWNGVTGTVGVSSGQWYFEYTYGGGTGGVVGVAKPTYNPSTEPGIADTVWRYRADDGTKRNGGASSSAYGATWTTGDVIGVAYDLDAGTLEFYKNGVSQGVAFTNLAGETVVPVAGTYSSSSASYVNFGQQPFKYDPPA